MTARIQRRGFLGAMLAAAVAPAIVRSKSLMRIIVPAPDIILPEDILYDPTNGTPLHSPGGPRSDVAYFVLLDASGKVLDRAPFGPGLPINDSSASEYLAYSEAGGYKKLLARMIRGNPPMTNHDPYLQNPSNGGFVWAEEAADPAWHDCWPRFDLPVSKALSDFFSVKDRQRADDALEGFLPYATRTVNEAELPADLTPIAIATRASCGQGSQP